MQDKSNPRGAVLILVVVVLSVLIGLAALLIDTGRRSLSARQLQNSADAASLAAARALNGGVDGWRNAKRVALMTLQSQSVTGMDEFPAALTFNSAAGTAGTDYVIDPLEDGAFRTNRGVSADGRWDVTIERGVFWSDAENSPPYFISLEGKSEIFNSMPYHIANAVRVRVGAKDIPLSFMNAFGTDIKADITRIGVAVLDTAVESCVAPIAIPACYLLLNTGEQADKYDDLNSYDEEAACEREIVASDAASEDPRRKDGATRSETFPRPPYKKNGLTELNRKALPIRAVVGVPAVATSGDVVGSVERDALLNALNSGCVSAKLGQPFRPLDRALDENNLFDDEFDEVLGKLINGDIPANRAKGEDLLTFREAFFRIDGTPKLNFPALRTKRPEYGPAKENVELEFRWPVVDRGFGGDAVMLFESMPAMSWTNPLCHSDRVKFPDDPDRAKVRQVTVMVVAPANEDGRKYCDFNAVFDGKEQDAYPPTSGTEPIIVGFKKAFIFDYNVKNLGFREAACDPEAGSCPCTNDPARAASQQCHVTYSHPENGKIIRAKNPAAVEDVAALGATQLTGDVEAYLIDLRRYKECLGCVVCRGRGRRERGCRPVCPVCTPPEPPQLEILPSDYEWSYCFDAGRRPKFATAEGFCAIPDSVPHWDETHPAPTNECIDWNTTRECCTPPDPMCPYAESCYDVQGDCRTYQKTQAEYDAEVAAHEADRAAALSEYRTVTYPAENMGFLKDEIAELLGTARADATVPEPIADWPLLYSENFCRGGLVLEPWALLHQELIAANNRFARRGKALEARHCLPQKRDDCFASVTESGTEAECWENPMDREPQYGCGGIRLRLSCEKEQVQPSAKTLSEMRPGLVE